MHGESHGCVKHASQAAFHYNESAGMDSVQGYFNLGHMHFFGLLDGAERNESEAFRLFKRGWREAGKDDPAAFLAWLTYAFLSLATKVIEVLTSLLGASRKV